MPFKFFSQRKNDLRELTVEELKLRLGELSRQRAEPLCMEAQKVRSRLEIELKELKKIGEEISSAPYRAGEMEAPFIGAISKAKDALSSTAMHEWDLGPPTLTNFEAVLNLKVKAVQVFKILHNVCSANRKVADYFLKSHLKKVEGKMRNIAHEVTMLEHLVNSHQGKVQDLSEMEDKSDELTNLIENRERSRDEHRSLEKKVAAAKLEIEEMSSKLNSLRKSSFFSEAETLVSDIIKLESEASNIEASIRGIVSSLNRPLNKYRYLVQGDKQKLRLLAILDHPELVLKQDESESLLHLILDVKRSVEKGEFQVKDCSKTAESLSRLAAMLPPLSKRYLELQRQIDERKSQTNKHMAVAEAELLKGKINELNVSKKKLTEEAAEAFKRYSQIEEEVKQKAKQMENELDQILGVKVKLKIPTAS